MRNNLFLLFAAIILSFQSGCAKTIYVSQKASGNGSGVNWENACTTISQAIDKSINVTREDDREWVEIWVAEGRYNETIEIEPNIRLYGGFQGNEENLEDRNWMSKETIIDVSGIGGSAVIAATDTTIDGFTVTGADQSGIYCLSSSPVIANCTIVNNRSEKGGGLCCLESSPSLYNCVFINNKAAEGGGLYGSKSSPLLNDCAFINNTATKGCGLYGQNSTVLFNTCSFTDNTATEGGGVYFSLSFSRIINCTVAQNTAEQTGGGFFLLQSSPVFRSCNLTDNAAEQGAGLFCTLSSPRMSHSIIARNKANS